ncbi:MAG: hypothetical protein LBM98_10450 [Oscillospiraceae bacterium]|jgi:stage III sporulation protein AG|nr:hypothetical protein [Oscillospiraceae bacterium]
MTKFQTIFNQYKYVLIVLAAGLLLLVLPKSEQHDKTAPARDSPAVAEAAYNASPDEAKLSALLSQIDGAGSVRIALSDNGAVIICQSAASGVKLGLTNAVTAYTGLTSNKIIILKGETQ